MRHRAMCVFSRLLEGDADEFSKLCATAQHDESALRAPAMRKKFAAVGTRGR
jgi:hypothetical protein